MKRSLSFSLIVLALGGLLGACGGDDDDGGGAGSAGETIEPKLSVIQEKIFTPTCALSSCHGGTEDLDLSAGKARAQLLDRASSEGSSKKRLVAGKPDESLLYLLLNGTTDGIDQMPQGSKLKANQIEAIRQWIAAGAQDD